MILTLTIALALLFGGPAPSTAGDTPQQNSSTGAASGEQPPPPDNEARAHIIDIG